MNSQKCSVLLMLCCFVSSADILRAEDALLHYTGQILSFFSHHNSVFIQRPSPFSQSVRIKCRLRLGYSLNVCGLYVAEMSLHCRSSSRKSRSCLLRMMPNCHPFSTSSAQPRHLLWNCTRKPWPTSTKVGFVLHWREGMLPGDN